MTNIGKHNNLPLDDFLAKQLARGIEVEMEHTDDPKIARKIALDHLAEDPYYYIYLDKMEEQMKLDRHNLMASELFEVSISDSAASSKEELQQKFDKFPLEYQEAVHNWQKVANRIMEFIRQLRKLARSHRNLIRDADSLTAELDYRVRKINAHIINFIDDDFIDLPFNNRFRRVLVNLTERVEEHVTRIENNLDAVNVNKRLGKSINILGGAKASPRRKRMYETVEAIPRKTLNYWRSLHLTIKAAWMLTPVLKFGTKRLEHTTRMLEGLDALYNKEMI